MEGELRQSEIISDLTQFTYDSVSQDVVETSHSYAILLSQDCDLLRDNEDRITSVARIAPRYPCNDWPMTPSTAARDRRTRSNGRAVLTPWSEASVGRDQPVPALARCPRT